MLTEVWCQVEEGVNMFTLTEESLKRLDSLLKMLIRVKASRMFASFPNYEEFLFTQFVHALKNEQVDPNVIASCSGLSSEELPLDICFHQKSSSQCYQCYYTSTVNQIFLRAFPRFERRNERADRIQLAIMILKELIMFQKSIQTDDFLE